MTWATNLVFGGYDDWRLASITDTGTPGCTSGYAGTDCGYNVDTTNSELAYMYHVNLGFEAYFNEDGSIDPAWGIFGNGTYNGIDFSSYGETDVGLIQNLQAYSYWSGTEYPDINSMAWMFVATSGLQYLNTKSRELYAWAVRDGDVAASQTGAVPEPSVLALMGLELLGVGVARRRKCKSMAV